MITRFAPVRRKEEHGFVLPILYPKIRKPLEASGLQRIGVDGADLNQRPPACKTRAVILKIGP
jgi:hypothetical protein